MDGRVKPGHDDLGNSQSDQTVMGMQKAEFRAGSDNIFRDLGFSETEAAEVLAKSELVAAIDETIRRRRLTQAEAAKLCTTDQWTLSKVLRGRLEIVTSDQLMAWLKTICPTDNRAAS